MKSYISPKVKIKKAKIGLGLYSTKTINRDEVLVDYVNAPGQFLTTKEADILYEKGMDYMLQIDDDLFFAATNGKELEISDYLNHSCDPNCGIKGKLKIVAMRKISPNEELTIDYAMSESSDYQIKCQCGAKNCRGFITGNDWKKRELQKRYWGYFSDYLQKRFKA